ncbi:hypothetical protein [Alienimonas chondri]|uniref:Chromosome partition protein Smc n=1 Tax=Alienimonas chondri TaxID=2681879 RepID=A0ABX1VC31_9PLAN|nr:hypothetical protein [Alienimonas chondri]NNJ25511.1 hypothetical protein [Alienimonas chondri]
MRSAAAPNAPAGAPPRSSDHASAKPSGMAWVMLALGLAGGLAFGQYTAGRAVQADLYALKKDVAQLRRSADALTAAGGRSGDVATLLEDLRAQRAAVKEADESWRAADAALARSARLRERAELALGDAEATAIHSQTVAVAVSDALEETRAARKSANEAGAVLRAVAGSGPQIAEARDAINSQALLMSEQADAFAAIRSAWDAARLSAEGLIRETAEVQAEASTATADLRGARTALADLSALKQLVRAAGADFPAVWTNLDGLITLRDWLADNPVPRLVTAPDDSRN